jgi:hypothetical protein
MSIAPAHPPVGAARGPCRLVPASCATRVHLRARPPAPAPRHRPASEMPWRLRSLQNPRRHRHHRPAPAQALRQFGRHHGAHRIDPSRRCCPPPRAGRGICPVARTAVRARATAIRPTSRPQFVTSRHPGDQRVCRLTTRTAARQPVAHGLAPLAARPAVPPTVPLLHSPDSVPGLRISSARATERSTCPSSRQRGVPLPPVVFRVSHWGKRAPERVQRKVRGYNFGPLRCRTSWVQFSRGLPPTHGLHIWLTIPACALPIAPALARSAGSA